MKKLLIAIFTTAALAFLACGNDQHGEHGSSDAAAGEAKAHGAGKEYTSAYICPMHCQGSGSDQAGTCPACGMDYVAQADHVKDGHQH